MTIDSACNCEKRHESTDLVVITGGPGAGKTAVLEFARKQLCEHVAILPESASIVFGGGFWRLNSVTAKMASQRAIYHIQNELETLVKEERRWGLALCDRGTLDGLAYWPKPEKLFWKDLATSKKLEFKKYKAVIHLKTPSAELGYNHRNPIRVETAAEAAKIDKRIAEVWNSHRHYHCIESSHSFMDKISKALSLIEHHVPKCCKTINYEKTR